MDKNFKRLLFITSGIFVLIIVFVIFTYVMGIGKDVVEMVVAPKDTTLLLDDSTAIKPGKLKVKTGTHTIKANRQDFEDQTKEFTTVDDQENIVWFEMIPSNQAGIDYRDTHKDEFQKVYEIANSKVGEATDNKVKKYPLIASLPASTKTLLFNSVDPKWAPYAEEYFVINYGQSQKNPYDSSRLAIYITANHPAGRQAAINYIYSVNFDPSDYEIVFETSTTSTVDEGTGIGEDFYQTQDDSFSDAEQEVE